MFPVAPIISSIITFLQTVSLSSNTMRNVSSGVVSILQRALDILSFIPPFDSRVQLVCVVYVFIAAVMCVLVFPISHLSAHPRSAHCRDTATALAADVRNFYMTGIAVENAESVVSIDARMRAFTDPLHDRSTARKLVVPCIAVGCAICAAIAAAAVYCTTEYTIITITLAVVSLLLILYSILGALFILIKCCDVLRTLMLRACIVLLELVYIPVTEALADMLHPYAPCGSDDVCVPVDSASDIVRRNYTCCATNNTAGYSHWHVAPRSEPWLDYSTDIIEHFSPFIAYAVLAVVVGVPALELCICYKCGRIIECAYTTGDDADAMYEDAISNIKTPVKYTFFAYKRRYVHMPAILFAYKAAVVAASHVDETYMHAPILLPALTGFAMTLCGAINVHRYKICQVMDTIMYVLGFVVCLMPLFTDSTTIITIIKCAASAIPVLVFVFVFIASLVHNRRMRDVDVLSVDGYSEDGDVVRNRQATLYACIDAIINTEAANIITVYSIMQLLIGIIAVMYFVYCVI